MKEISRRFLSKSMFIPCIPAHKILQEMPYFQVYNLLLLKLNNPSTKCIDAVVFLRCWAAELHHKRPLTPPAQEKKGREKHAGQIKKKK